MKRIAILGSTGSIGRSTLSVIESYPDRFQVATLAAGNNAELAFEQAVRWQPRVLSLSREQDAATLRDKLRKAGLSQIEVVHGSAGTVCVATHPEVDFVVSAIVGVSGLEATYEAIIDAGLSFLKYANFLSIKICPIRLHRGRAGRY